MANDQQDPQDGAKDVAADAFRYLAGETYPQEMNSAVDPLLTDAGVQERFERATYGKRYTALPDGWDADRFFTALNKMCKEVIGCNLFFETPQEVEFANTQAGAVRENYDPRFTLTLEGPIDA